MADVNPYLQPGMFTTPGGASPSGAVPAIPSNTGKVQKQDYEIEATRLGNDVKRQELDLGKPALDAEAVRLSNREKQRTLDRSIPPPGHFQQLSPGSETIGRLATGLDAAIEAEKQMQDAEGRNDYGALRNPFQASLLTRGAKMFEDTAEHPVLGRALSEAAGDDYQTYQRASKAWESAFMPIASGANVTPSEAQRQIQARLPDMQDTRHTLTSKALDRQMVINGAADLVGRERPFPDTGARYFSTTGKLTEDKDKIDLSQYQPGGVPLVAPGTAPAAAAAAPAAAPADAPAPDAAPVWKVEKVK